MSLQTAERQPARPRSREVSALDRVLTRAAAAILARAGWSVRAPALEVPCVLVAAPHTSKWDLPLLIAVPRALGLRSRWMAKHTLFRFPLGTVLRALGGFSIERHKHTGVVETVAAMFARDPELVLVIAPEATRRRVRHWRSGFYRIAQAARVPVALMYLDYEHREVHIGLSFRPSGDIRADMERVRAFYADRPVKVERRFAPPRLREEEE